MDCKERMWAYCFIKGLGINTELILINGCRRIPSGNEYCYLKGKVNKRVDNCLIALLDYIRDKSFDRLKKNDKGRINAQNQTNLRGA